MKNFKHVAAGVFGLLIFSTPLMASALSISVQSLLPGTNAIAKQDVTFKVTTPSGNPMTYQLSDSFTGSSATVSNINAAGNFAWTPGVSDVGTHTFTITATDYSSGSPDIGTVTQTITVAPPPSISIQSISPGKKIMPGATLTFFVSQSGFTNPTYSLGDTFSGSGVGNVSVGSSGNFSWTPSNADNGKHTITVYASDSQGHGNSASVDIVVGTGDTLMVGSITPGVNVPLGQNLTFNVVPIGFAPTAYSVKDNFPGSTVSNANINTAGNFSWLPSGTEAGTHVLTVTGQVGAFGESASTTQSIVVLGQGGVAAPTPVAAQGAATSSTTGGVLTALQAQLAALTAKIAGQSSAGGSPVPTAVGTFNVYLHPGMDGDDVTRLQTILSQLGFFSDVPNGHYGPLTTTAVQKFQAAHGLDQLGVVGPATRVVLNGLSPSASSGTNTTGPVGDGYVFNNFMGLGEDTTDGSDVLELQKRLMSNGFLTGDATGYFGLATQSAVKKFQVAHGISATGFVGIQTRTALNK